MNEKELDILLNALFPENITTPSSTTHTFAKPCDPIAGLGYVAKQSEYDKKVITAFKRLDGSDKKAVTRGNGEVRKPLSGTDIPRQKANFTSSVRLPKEPDSCSKVINRPQRQSFMDRIFQKVKR